MHLQSLMLNNNDSVFIKNEYTILEQSNLNKKKNTPRLGRSCQHLAV